MTGEMSWIKASGEASDGCTYDVHAKVARALRSKLRPFDTYIGPYIAHKHGRLWISSEDGMLGTVCLWPQGIPPAFREPITAEYFPLDDAGAALEAAREVLKIARRA